MISTLRHGLGRSGRRWGPGAFPTARAPCRPQRGIEPRADLHAQPAQIIADDQDARQDSIDSMAAVQRLLVAEGTQFKRFYAPISVCCPSRSSFFRAQAAHVGCTLPNVSHHPMADRRGRTQNTNITSVSLPYGGWELFAEKGASQRIRGEKWREVHPG